MAQLPADSICFGDVIYQDVAVPGYEDVGPLVLEFQTRRGATQESWPRPGSFVGSALREAKIDSSTSWHDNRVCLGEDAYGGDTRIGFTQYELPRDCSYDPIHVDNAQLRTAAAGECPTPETPIRNGSFDDGDSAWRVDCDPNITCSPVQRGELVLDDPLCAVDVYGEVWLPSEATRPAAAIELSHRGGAGNQLSLTLNGWPVAGFHGDEQEHTSHVCLPVWARGTSVELGFHTDRGGWFCSSAEYVDYVIDDVALVDEPGCPAAAQPLDGDFEGFGGALAFPWVIENDANGQMRAPAVAVVHDAGAALAGDSSLRLEVSYGCQTARVVQGVRVPQLVDDGGGAAVRYGYRHPPPADGAPKASLCVGQQCDELAPAAEWTEQTLCIDPKLQGRVLDLLLRLDGGTGSCTVPLSQPIEVWFDEVTVTTDRDCPAQ